MGHSTNTKEIVYCRPVRYDYKANKGLNPLSYIDKELLAHSFTALRYKDIDKHVLVIYFGIVKGLSLVVMFRVMQAILANPYRHVTFLSRCTSGHGNRTVISNIINWLVKEGYVSVVMRPRKLMMLNSYTMDKTYLINKKGKRVMQLVYEAVGLM